LNQFERILVRHPIDQHEIELDVTIPMIFPVARQRVIAESLSQRFIVRAVQFSILGGEFDDGGEVERGAVAGILDVVGA
jgi:hypothetical protein